MVSVDFQYLSTYKHANSVTFLFKSISVCIALDVPGPADDARRLPNTLNISFRGIRAPDAINALKKSVAFSAGSACHSGR